MKMMTTTTAAKMAVSLGKSDQTAMKDLVLRAWFCCVGGKKKQSWVFGDLLKLKKKLTQLCFAFIFNRTIWIIFGVCDFSVLFLLELWFWLYVV